ncbi:MAG: hypothetical protein ABIP48_19530, partial [Planctomycetota bacterium]
MLRRHSFAWLVVLLVAIPSLSIAGAPRPNSNPDGVALREGAVLVGMAEIDITPDFPVRLAGYAGRMDEAGEVIARLSGKALAIGGNDGDGPAVLIMLENCSTTAKLTHEIAQEYGRQLAQEVNRVLQGEFKPVDPKLTARQKTIEVPLGALPTREELQKRAENSHLRLGARDVAHHFLRILDRDGALPKSFDYPITTWTFGDDLAIVFLPGEVTIDYALRLKRELDGLRLWVTAYANAMPCYICSKRLLGEGGYEVDSSMVSYGQPSRLAPEAEDKIIR